MSSAGESSAIGAVDLLVGIVIQLIQHREKEYGAIVEQVVEMD
jgi:hypothetical protein